MITTALLALLLSADTSAAVQSPPLPSSLSSARHQDIGRIQRALNIHEQETGMQFPGAEVERKLARMSDLEVRQFADALETKRHIGSPVNVVIGSIIILIMFVVLIVRLVE